MSDFQSALTKFLESVNADMHEHFSTFEHSTFGPGPDDDYGPVVPSTGKKYLKLIHKSGSQTFVYAFVATVDVPEKNVKRGHVLMAATWKAPALARKVPSVINIFEPSTYEGKSKVTDGWLSAGAS